VWESVSEGAKDLVSKILTADPAKRLKGSEILRHPWMMADDAFIPDVALTGTTAQLKRFQARRRLKKAIQGIRSTIRMKLLMAARTAATLERNAADGGALEKAAGSSGLAGAMLSAARAAKEAGGRPAEGL